MSHPFKPCDHGGHCDRPGGCHQPVLGTGWCIYAEWAHSADAMHAAKDVTALRCRRHATIPPTILPPAEQECGVCMREEGSLVGRRHAERTHPQPGDSDGKGMAGGSYVPRSASEMRSRIEEIGPAEATKRILAALSKADIDGFGAPRVARRILRAANVHSDLSGLLPFAEAMLLAADALAAWEEWYSRDSSEQKREEARELGLKAFDKLAEL